LQITGNTVEVKEIADNW